MVTHSDDGRSGEGCSCILPVFTRLELDSSGGERSGAAGAPLLVFEAFADELAATQAQRVNGFIKHWNLVERHPFRWTWRTDKLQNDQRLAA